MMREPSIDILRFIGISLLILAHTNVPFSLMQARMFDVPMMVFISGLSFSGKSIDDPGHFYWTRLKRLLIPVWTFIPIYLLPHAMLEVLGWLDCNFTWSSFWRSFIFYKNAMGYIWIFKVFIIVMIATPLLIRINVIIRNDYIYFLLVLLMVALQQVLCLWFFNHPGFSGRDIIETYGLYILGYLPMFMLGLRVRSADRKAELILLSLISIVMVPAVFCYYLHYGLSFNLSLFKYPPQSYYMIYGCFMSLLFWSLRKPIVRFLNYMFSCI